MPSDPLRTLRSDRWADPFSGDELAGRVCLVTGAAQGIGATIAEALAAHGGAVIVTDRNEADAQAQAERLRDSGARAVAHALDVTDTEQIDDVLGRVEADWARSTCSSTPASASCGRPSRSPTASGRRTST